MRRLAVRSLPMMQNPLHPQAPLRSLHPARQTPTSPPLVDRGLPLSLSQLSRAPHPQLQPALPPLPLLVLCLDRRRPHRPFLRAVLCAPLEPASFQTWAQSWVPLVRLRTALSSLPPQARLAQVQVSDPPARCPVILLSLPLQAARSSLTRALARLELRHTLLSLAAVVRISLSQRTSRPPPVPQVELPASVLTVPHHSSTQLPPHQALSRVMVANLVPRAHLLSAQSLLA